jgi:hypothetical protein
MFEATLTETTPMLAFSPNDLREFTIPIGIGIAVLVILAVPGLRASIINSFQKGHEAGERARGKKPGEN